MSSTVRFQCPSCKTLLQASSARAGDKIGCAKCGQRIQVPSPSAVPPAVAVVPSAAPAPGDAPLELAPLDDADDVAASPKRRIIVTTGNEVAGHEITEYLGVVRGIVVRIPTLAQEILGEVQVVTSLFGSSANIEKFAEICDQARRSAYRKMVKHAIEKGADAVIAMRYDTNEFRTFLSEVFAYGTAVKLRQHPK